MLFSALVLEAVFHQNSEVFFLATTNHPEHGKHRRQRSAGFAAAAVVGKVLGTLVLIGVITCAIMACFAVVYVQTYIIPNAHLDGNFDMNLTSTIYYKDSALGSMWSISPSTERRTGNWWSSKRSRRIWSTPLWPLRTSGSGPTPAWTGSAPSTACC